MFIQSLTATNYKSYRSRLQFQIKPLTVVIGSNNAGKSALLRLLPLLAGSMAFRGLEAIDLNSCGLSHAKEPQELVFGQSSHGSFELGMAYEFEGQARSFSAVVQNLTRPGRSTSPIINSLELIRDGGARLRIHGSKGKFKIATSENETFADLAFEGLLPRAPLPNLPEIDSELLTLRQLASRICYLKGPRKPWGGGWTPFPPDSPDWHPDGSQALPALAMDDDLAEQTRDWLLQAMGIDLQIQAVGKAYLPRVTTIGQSQLSADLANAGQGITQVIPVVVQRLLGCRHANVTLVEHPEADLHPSAHGAIADLFVDFKSVTSPAIIETHSEMFLLRLRRRVAEGKLAPTDIGIVWVGKHPDGGAQLENISISRLGDVENWPAGVFYEDYDEVLAIRRAARRFNEGNH